MDINFYQYHKKEDGEYIWLWSHIYEENPNIFNKYTHSFRDSIDYLTIDELKIINDFYYKIWQEHKVELKFHTQYFLETGILDQKRSIERRKDKTNTFDNRLSFSLISKTHAVLVPLYIDIDTDFFYIPQNLSLDKKQVPLKILDIDTILRDEDRKVFPNKKLTFKELKFFIHELQSLNDKLNYLLKKGNPLFIQTQ